MELVRVLSESSNEDLEYLVNYLEKAGFTETLTQSPGYRAHNPNHSMYVAEIAHHIRLFGGNTLVNFFREEGPPYEEIVRDVANKLGVDFNYDDSVEQVEMKILLKKIKKAFDEGMSADEQKEFIKACEQEGINKKDFRTGFPMAALLAQLAVQSSGFLAYQIAVIVANSVAKAFLGRGLKVATNNAALRRLIDPYLAYLWWSLSPIIALAGPAYRVIIPCACHVAYLRRKVHYREDFGDGE